MATEEIKEMLDEWLEDALDGYESDESYNSKGYFKALGKWKRLSKKRDQEGSEHRVFLNTVLNKKALVIDACIQGWLSEGAYAFYIYKKEIDEYNTAPCYVAITDLAYFKSKKVLNDWHLSGLVALPDYLDELCEADFASEKSLEETKADLLQYGLVEDEKFTAFMTRHC